MTGDSPTLVNGGKFKFNNASSVDATSSVMLTEYFVNTPKMGAITIKKELDSSQHDYADLVGEFTFKLYLENVFGINGVNVVNSTAKDKGYNKIDVTRLDKNNSSSTYTGYKMTATDGKYYGEFKLKAGETLTINNIPYNTSYRIVEVSSTHDPKTPDTQYTTGNVLEGTLNNNKSAKLNASTGNYDENTANNATVVNTRLTGELKFQKTLGTYAAENGITGSSEFVYHVVLKAPSGVDLTEYISSSDVTALDASGVLQSGTCTFNVTVTADDDPLKSLSGVPYGTTYTVEEHRTDNAANVTSVEDEVTTAATLDRSNASPTVNITNNYPAPVHNLKIKEVTDFKDVNEGLLKLTKQAADSDVFQYTVKNRGTTTPGNSEIPAPTYDYYQRENDETDQGSANPVITKLTGATIRPPRKLKLFIKIDDVTKFKNHIFTHICKSKKQFPRKSIDTNIYFDKSAATNWVKSDRYLKAFVWKDSDVRETGKIYSPTSQNNNIYTFNNFPADADKVIWYRCKTNLADGSGYPGTAPSDTLANALPEASFVFGDVFGPTNSTSFNEGGLLRNVNPVAPFLSVKNFLDGVDNPNSSTTYNVANTNYIWKTAFSTKTSGNDEIDDETYGMTNTTDGSGNFWLMYGTKYVENVTTEKESSAEFIKQFKVDNDNPSVMTVTQNGKLSAPSHPATSPAEFAAGSRNVSTYYDTEVTATDTAGNDITFTTNSNGNTVFDLMV